MKHKQAFKDKVAIVTGSSMGIGKATAKLLGEQGAKVVLNGRTAERLEQTAANMKSIGLDVLAVQADMSKVDDCKKLIDETIKYYGRLDILINNAGMSSRGYFEELDPKVFQDMMNINFLGCVFPTRFAIPHLKESKGSVVFISSVAGIRGLPETIMYCASKMALTSIAESLKVELAEYHIHVGIVYVGITQNDEGKKVIGKDGKLVLLESREDRKAQNPEDVAKSIVKNIKKRKFKSILTLLGKVNFFANILIPRIVDRILIRAKGRINQMNK
ncbi:short-subunit dehydrogenase [Catalinimonas alkaloidigena]|uniref:SDR family oxidoreductase n=1 Tax=Catalinimonas alkaloidigena TaxID=1075417 RepID=UPI00240509D2|nr:SDR family oxidoreductase [Catalinimonas alkaloidigena]MDF9796062.1 short-subunit dehydrogenase [Catalinimonas alkaloidigena]